MCLIIPIFSELDSLDTRVKVLEDARANRPTNLKKMKVQESDFQNFPKLPLLNDWPTLKSDLTPPSPHDPYAFVWSWWFIGAMTATFLIMIFLVSVFGFLICKRQKSAQALQRLAEELREAGVGQAPAPLPPFEEREI